MRLRKTVLPLQGRYLMQLPAASAALLVSAKGRRPALSPQVALICVPLQTEGLPDLQGIREEPGHYTKSMRTGKNRPVAMTDSRPGYHYHNIMSLSCHSSIVSAIVFFGCPLHAHLAASQHQGRVNPIANVMNACDSACSAFGLRCIVLSISAAATAAGIAVYL